MFNLIFADIGYKIQRTGVSSDVCHETLSDLLGEQIYSVET